MGGMPDIFGDTDGLPATTRTGIPYEIETFTQREVWAPGRNTTTVNCRVAWEFAHIWVTDMVGRVYVDKPGSTMFLRRDRPEFYPLDPKQYCTRVEQIDQGGEAEDGTVFVTDDGIKTHADPGFGWPVTKWKRYKATFESLPFEVKTDLQVDNAGASYERELLRYVVRQQKAVPREQQIPGGGFYIVGTTTRLMNTGFKTIVFSDVTYTWVRVPVGRIPQEATDHQGKINDGVFDRTGAVTSPAGYGWTDGTLLYTGFDDSNKYWDANEDWVVDLVYYFRYKSIGWNYFLNNLGEPVEVSSDGTTGGTKPYESADLNELFRPYDY